MGEYAKFNGTRIKIGMCESMYYLRYEDRKKVIPESGSINPRIEKDCFWRLPYPDEDHLHPGQYHVYNRGFGLHKKDKEGYWINFSNPETIQYPGTIQLKHENSGLLVNMPCYHGERLPNPPPEGKVFWNGKGWSFELAFIKNTDEGVFPIVRCRHCGQMWSYGWKEILPYIQDPKLKDRFEQYTSQ